MRMALAATLATVAASVTGCPSHTTPFAPEPELAAAQRNFNALWDASLAALRKYRFQVARQDRRNGVIETEPMVSRHATEVWRREAWAPGAAAESTIQTIYRKAIVRVVPVEPGSAEYRADVTVRVSRSDDRAPQITSTSQAYSLFTGTAYEWLQVRYGDEPYVPPGTRRTTLGRDEELEEKLLAAIRPAR